MSHPVWVLIVDDQELVRQGLRTLLEFEDDIEVVGEAANGVEALRKIPATKPEVALVDVRMPRMDGVELIGRLSEDHPSIAAIVLTTFDDDEYIFGGLKAGAKGYLLKDTSSNDLVQAIEGAGRGESVLGGEISNREIARSLYITEGTAKNYISKILRKLDLRDRTQAALYAAERGWT